MVRIFGRAILVTALSLSVAAPRNPHGTTGVRTCVGADLILRYDPPTHCAAGKAAYQLAEADGEVTGPTTGNEAGAARIVALEGQLSALETRLTTLDAEVAELRQRNAKPFRVPAPFEVYDAANKPIFRVGANPRSMTLLFPSGNEAALASALPGGGFFKALADGSASDVLQTVVGVDGKAALVAVRQGRKPRGVLAIGEDGKAALTVSNENDVQILAITQGHSGGGLLQLDDATGTPTVEAGTDAVGRGEVHVGPGPFACVSGGIAAPTCLKGRPK